MVHYSWYPALVLSFLIFFACATFDVAKAATTEIKVEAFTVGKVTVWAIADSIGERDIVTVFPNADPALTAKYVPGGKAPTATMVFVVKINGQIVLIDTGNGNAASQLMNGLTKVGITPEAVTLVLLTHLHGDHIEGLVKDDKVAFPNAKIMLSKPERDFWHSDAGMAAFPARKAGFENARRILNLYGDKVSTYAFGDTIIPGIVALDSTGHTPGQTCFLLESDGQKLVFWGDLVHAAALQFPRPELNATFDMAPTAAAARKRYMEQAVAEKLPIAGAHLPFPGIGRVEAGPEGGFVYKPGL